MFISSGLVASPKEQDEEGEEEKKEREEQQEDAEMKKRVSAADLAGNGIEDWLRDELAAHAQIPAEQAERERETGNKRDKEREGAGERGSRRSRSSKRRWGRRRN